MAIERLYARNCYRLRMTADGNEIDELFSDRQHGSPAKAYQAAKARETDLATPAPAAPEPSMPASSPSSVSSVPPAKTKKASGTKKAAAAKPVESISPPEPPATPAPSVPAPSVSSVPKANPPVEDDMHCLHLRTYTGARNGQMVHEFLVRLPVPAGAEMLVPEDYAINGRREICEVFSITRLGAMEAVKQARLWRDEMGRRLYGDAWSPAIAAGDQD